MRITIDLDIDGEKDEVIEAFRAVFGYSDDEKALKECIKAIKREKEGTVRE